jgi:hypothetical protein
VQTKTTISFVYPARCLKAPGLWLIFACFLVLFSGCNRLRHQLHETVYVNARQMYLHDRVAAVSNRVAEVKNGQPLRVLAHGRRFLKVETEGKQVGWIEERAVIDEKTFEGFDQLAKQHKDDPVVATATLRDDIYLHILPGRETDRFYLLDGNSKVQLLVRASVLKAAPGSAPAPKLTPKPAPPPVKPVNGSKSTAKTATAKPTSSDTDEAAAPAPEAPPMEDWWLARDGQGHTGWLLAGGLYVDLPDEIAIFSEGQRMVGAYVLNQVFDSEANTPNHQVTQYVAVLAPPKSGMPFDFDQVRVFCWSLKHHRYETSFRLHPIKGYLPVRVMSSPSGAPVFNFQIANGDNLTTDSTTGVTRPVSSRTLTFMLLNQQVHRTGSDMGPIPVGQTEAAKAKAAKAAAKKSK